MSAMRPMKGSGAAALALALVLFGAHSGAAADSTDAVQLGVGMGAMGALVGSTAGPTGALVGGLVGFGLGASMGGASGPKTPRDPAVERQLAAERAAWGDERRRSEEQLRDQQRSAFEERLLAGSSVGAPADPAARSVLSRPGSGSAAGAGLTASGAPERAGSGLAEQVQASLTRLGYDVGRADGVVDQSTVSAIEAYQLDHQLLMTGKPSTELLTHMRQRGG